MRFFRRDNDEQHFVSCPGCSQLVAANALECELCGTDLRELPPETQRYTAKEVSQQGNPYGR